MKLEPVLTVRKKVLSRETEVSIFGSSSLVRDATARVLAYEEFSANETVHVSRVTYRPRRAAVESHSCKGHPNVEMKISRLKKRVQNWVAGAWERERRGNDGGNERGVGRKGRGPKAPQTEPTADVFPRPSSLRNGLLLRSYATGSTGSLSTRISRGPSTAQRSGN